MSCCSVMHALIQPSTARFEILRRALSLGERYWQPCSAVSSAEQLQSLSEVAGDGTSLVQLSQADSSSRQVLGASVASVVHVVTAVASEISVPLLRSISVQCAA